MGTNRSAEARLDKTKRAGLGTLRLRSVDDEVQTSRLFWVTFDNGGIYSYRQFIQGFRHRGFQLGFRKFIQNSPSS